MECKLHRLTFGKTRKILQIRHTALSRAQSTVHFALSLHAPIPTVPVVTVQETGNLQRRQENIDRTLRELDHVINYYNVSKEVEAVIRLLHTDFIHQATSIMHLIL